MKVKELSTEERENAWIGDAVLSLYARTSILAEQGRMDQEMLQAMTCNQFLATLGQPTRVEADIGVVYKEKGLEAAFQHIESALIPAFQKQWKNTRKLASRQGR